MEKNKSKMEDNMTTDRGMLSKSDLEGESTDSALLRAKRTNKEKCIEMLNALVGTNNDRIVGYETALQETQENDLKDLFLQFIETSKKCRLELITEIVRLGGKSVEPTQT